MDAYRPPLIGTGLYPLRQAARLVGSDARTVGRWLKGYSWKAKNGRGRSRPLWPLEHVADEDLGDERVLGFRDLLELRTVARFVDQGVSLRVIRATIDVARAYLGDYPLHSRRFLTDGKRIFLQAVERAGEEPRLLDVRRRQFVFEDIIRPSLFGGIEYAADGQALRWFPLPRSRQVVLDPQIQFGEPVVAEAGVPSDAVYAAYLAEGKDVARVARLYAISPSAVQAAVRFEQQLAA